MAVTGYYSSVCQGMSMVSGVVNVAAGIAIAVFGVLTSIDSTTRPFGYMYLGYLMVAAGLFIIINSILIFVGAIRESKPSLKGGLIGTAIVVFLLLAIMGYAFVLKGKVDKGGRKAYLKLSNEQKALVEKRLECCGWDDPEKDHSPDCNAKHTCDKPMGRELGKKGLMRLLIPAAVLIAQAFVLFAAGCYTRKVSKQSHPKLDKNATLNMEAQYGREGRSIEAPRKSRLKKAREKKEAKREKRKDKK